MPLSEEQYQQLEDWMRGEAHDLERLRELLSKVVQFAETLQQGAQNQPEIETLHVIENTHEIPSSIPSVTHGYITDGTAMYSATIYAQIVLNAKGSLKLLDYAKEHYRKPVLERDKSNL